MGHVRVVPCVLDDDGLCPTAPHLAALDLEGDATLAALFREYHLDPVLRLSGEQRPGSGLGGGGGAGTGGPAGPEVLALRPRHARRNGGLAQLPARRHRPPSPNSCGTCGRRDRKSTRLNSSHANISYAVFC